MGTREGLGKGRKRSGRWEATDLGKKGRRLGRREEGWGREGREEGWGREGRREEGWGREGGREDSRGRVDGRRGEGRRERMGEERMVGG